MFNISVPYFACYRHSLHSNKPNPLHPRFQPDCYQMSSWSWPVRFMHDPEDCHELQLTYLHYVR